MTTATPAPQALAALRGMLAGRPGYAAADWALTLHMLEQLAPGFFAAERLGAELAAALEALLGLPAEFPAAIDPHEAMARVDAVYLRSIRGLPAKRIEGSALAAWVEANTSDHPLHAWFVAELARELGLGLPRVWRSRYPFKTSSPRSHLYMLTHELMLDTRFFSRPLRLPAGPGILDELAAAVSVLLSDREWDLAAELVFTLRAAGRECGLAVPLDCGPAAGESPREMAHRVATGLIAAASRPEAPPPGGKKDCLSATVLH